MTQNFIINIIFKKYYISGHQQGASSSTEVNIYQENMEINDDILSVLLICLFAVYAHRSQVSTLIFRITRQFSGWYLYSICTSIHMYESGLLVWYSLKKLGIAIQYTVQCTQYTGIAIPVYSTVYWDSYTLCSILG